MRIWDIDPGYLNRQSLLGEHRELHGIVAILVQGKKGYSRHPETLRWAGHGWALRQRHRLLTMEMALRGYTDRSPVRTRSGNGVWPEVFLDQPYRQMQLLREKYKNKEAGRIPLPANGQELWRQHKYSVLARDQELYRQIGREMAGGKGDEAALAARLVSQLRIPPAPGGIRNSLQHMWGYVSGSSPAGGDIPSWSLQRLHREIMNRAAATDQRYLLESTALGELMAWLR